MIIFLSEFHRGRNYSCVVFNTVLVLSIDSIPLDLFRHRFSPFDSLTLLHSVPLVSGLKIPCPDLLLDGPLHHNLQPLTVKHRHNLMNFKLEKF